METITGFIHGIRIIPTTIDTYMIAFFLSGKRCLAFNDLARRAEALEGQKVQVEGFWRPYRDECEFDVWSIKYPNAAGRFVTVGE
jgi:hypothetical protein